MRDQTPTQLDLNSLKTLNDVLRATKQQSGDFSRLKFPPFSTKSGSKSVWLVEKSSLTPSIPTLVSSKGFEVAYRQQLETILYHEGEDARLGSGLAEVAFLYDRMVEHGTIQVKSSTFVKRVPSIVKVLNAFFRENEKDIDAISTMITAQSNQPTPKDE